jgi:hypothetical protein
MVMNRIPYDVGPRVGGDRRKKSKNYFRAWPHGVQHRHFASTSGARLISHIIGVMNCSIKQLVHGGMEMIHVRDRRYVPCTCGGGTARCTV